ncbi:MAG: hypothetical protein CMQ34_09795 [Gammaproteobacteria bacterium]|nr:hypothetical protein [Gammaproteobacteria bacterium]|tara:strand:- start:113 stop:646 length:534 start_codon:yes stop_codon:yes gene_type:complete
MKTEPIEQEATEKAAAVDPDVQQQFNQLDGLLLDFKPEPEDDAQGADAADASPAPTMETGEMCTALLTVIFTLMAGRRGDHWMLSDKESEMLGNALAAVLDKYIPKMQGGPEATLIVVTLLIVGPRAMADRQVKKARAEQARAKPAKQDEKRKASEDQPAPQPAGADASDLWIKEAA